MDRYLPSRITYWSSFFLQTPHGHTSSPCDWHDDANFFWYPYFRSAYICSNSFVMPDDKPIGLPSAVAMYRFHLNLCHSERSNHSWATAKWMLQKAGKWHSHCTCKFRHLIEGRSHRWDVDREWIWTFFFFAFSMRKLLPTCLSYNYWYCLVVVKSGAAVCEHDGVPPLRCCRYGDRRVLIYADRFVFCTAKIFKADVSHILIVGFVKDCSIHIIQDVKPSL